MPTTGIQQQRACAVINTVAAVRAAVRADMAVMIDMHTRFDLPTALRIVKALEAIQFTWIRTCSRRTWKHEESGLSSSTPICAGENYFSRINLKLYWQMKAAISLS